MPNFSLKTVATKFLIMDLYLIFKYLWRLSFLDYYQKRVKCYITQKHVFCYIILKRFGLFIQKCVWNISVLHNTWKDVRTQCISNNDMFYP